MTPPEALLSGCTRLSLDAFSAEFAAAWSRLERRFLKVECWQEYQEIEAAASQEAYDRGDVALARELLRSEACPGAELWPAGLLVETGELAH
jgi:hypothetical protein